MKCTLCGDLDHAWCGFCADCKEHTRGLKSCLHCEDVIYDAKPCPKSPTGQHVVDEDSEALSECCGASGYAYDVWWLDGTGWQKVTV